MKRSILAVLALCGMLAVATSASAIPLEYSVTFEGSTINVGIADTLYSYVTNPGDPTDVTNPDSFNPSNPTTEANWINKMFGSSYTGDQIAKYDPPTMIATNDENVFAVHFTKMLNPEFFIVKAADTHYLFDNWDSEEWGVIDLRLLGGHDVSHVGTLGGSPEMPVPEPGTIVLLGAGLIGLGIYGRKRIRK